MKMPKSNKNFFKFIRIKHFVRKFTQHHFPPPKQPKIFFHPEKLTLLCSVILAKKVAEKFGTLAFVVYLWRIVCDEILQTKIVF